MRKTSEAMQQTRERLLAAAADEFAQKGFERAKIDEISLAAGCAKGTIYNYFPSKEDLFVAVIEGASTAAAAATGPRDAPARERLTAVLAGFCSWARDNDALARVFVRECLMGTPHLYPRVIGAEAPLRSAVEGILVDGVARGEIRTDLPPATLADAMLGLTDLALVQYWTNGAPVTDLDSIPTLVVTLLLDPGRR